jgi:hypothetical protein
MSVCSLGPLKVKKAGWNNDYLLALLGIDPA